MPLIEDGIRMVCRHDHPLSTRSRVAWAELSAFDVVAMAQGTGLRRLIDRQLPGIDLFRNATYEIARVPSILDVVEQSDCVFVTPALMLAAPHIASRFHHRRLVDPSITRSIGLIVPRDAVLSATAEAFRQALIAHLRVIDPQIYPFVRLVFRLTVLHGSAGGRSSGISLHCYERATYCGRPSSSIWFSALTAISTSVARR
jgi:DNA-binding transcriptional LysR family regulator